MDKDPKKKPNIIGALLFLLFCAMMFRFVFEMTRPDPQVVTAAQKTPAVEEMTKPLDNGVPYVAYGNTIAGRPTRLFKYETNTHVVYFTDQGGVWGHPK
jgi:hypothetical protein